MGGSSLRYRLAVRRSLLRVGRVHNILFRCAPWGGSFHASWYDLRWQTWQSLNGLRIQVACTGKVIARRGLYVRFLSPDNSTSCVLPCVSLRTRTCGTPLIILFRPISIGPQKFKRRRHAKKKINQM